MILLSMILSNLSGTPERFALQTDSIPTTTVPSFMKTITRLFSILVAVALPAWAAEKPNILVYLSDDHSQFDCSLYGDKSIPVPNMEKLAKDGIRLDRCYVASPSCAPSRAVLLTGLMPARSGAEDNHSKPKPGTHSLIEDLKKAGYETACFGKVAHYGHGPDYGFDYIGPERPKNLGVVVDEWLAKRESKKPLCLFVGTHDPHVSWPAKTTFDGDALDLPPTFIDTPDTREHRALFAQAVRNLDNLLGRLRKISAERLGENTLFIHTSDHGSQWPFGKWNLYDYGTRVPFVAAWPGKIKPGTTSDAMVSWVDLLPTLIDVTGGTQPSGLDGKSFLPVLLGEKSTFREWKLIHNLRPDLAFTNHSDIDRLPLAGRYWTEWVEAAKTDDRAKAIVKRYHQRPEFELYQVSKDKWELENKIDAPEQKERVAKMKQELAAWMKDQGDTGKIFAKPRPLDQPETWQDVPRKADKK